MTVLLVVLPLLVLYVAGALTSTWLLYPRLLDRAVCRLREQDSYFPRDADWLVRRSRSDAQFNVTCIAAAWPLSFPLLLVGHVWSRVLGAAECRSEFAREQEVERMRKRIAELEREVGVGER